MARTNGLLGISANWEPQIAEPFDARLVVETKADLTSTTQWEANDGNVYTYKGMIVAVTDDGANNGVYKLVDDDYTIAENWTLVGADDLTGLVPYTGADDNLDLGTNDLILNAGTLSNDGSQFTFSQGIQITGNIINALESETFTIDETKSLSDKQDNLIFGITNTNALQVDDTGVSDGNYAKFTASGIEGQTFSQVRDDLNVEDGAEVNNISDNNATDLTDGEGSTLHYHAADRDRSNHTGDQTASTISDFHGEVDSNTNVFANSTHRSSDGTDHDYIDQDLQESASPVFANVTSNNNATANSDLVRLDQVNSMISGLDWQESVIDQVDFTTSEPTILSAGDRYINTVTGTSSDTSTSVTANYIYEWVGAWDEIEPDEGFTVWIQDVDTNYTYNGSNWVEFGSTVSHNNTTDLQGGDTSEYYHLNSADYSALTNANAQLSDLHTDGSPTFAGLEASGHIIPATNGGYDFGSIDRHWREIYANIFSSIGHDMLFRAGSNDLTFDSEGLFVLRKDTEVMRFSGMPPYANFVMTFGDLEGENNNVYLKLDDDNQKFIFNNGNVGIGTTTPATALDVSGDITVSGTVDGVDIDAFKLSYDNHNHEGVYLDEDSNLSDLTNTSDARTNIGLGNVPNIDTTNASNITSGELPSEVLPAIDLNELDNVETAALADRDVLIYNNTSSVWENKTLFGAGIAETSALHDALTLGTANGLGLSQQELSLALANTTTTGALSSTDWNTFNNKMDTVTNSDLTGLNISELNNDSDYISDVTGEDIETLSNVETTAASDGQILKWNNTASEWQAEDEEDDVYTGDAERDVGGIADGDSFTDASMAAMWDALIKQEKFPTLIDPSSTFSASRTGYWEVGEVIDITFDSAFDRGSINPDYECGSDYRSGLPNEYKYTGTGLTNVTTTSQSDEQTVSNYTVVINGQSWTGAVAHDVGVQPLSSYGNDYDTPYAAGDTAIITRTITGVYPYFAKTAAIGDYAKQPLASHGSTITVTMVAESGSDKQGLQVWDTWGTLDTLEQYNDLSGEWDSISTSTFDTTTISKDINDNSVDYTQYLHNGSLIGERQLRFTFV